MKGCIWQLKFGYKSIVFAGQVIYSVLNNVQVSLNDLKSTANDQRPCDK